MTGSTVLTVTNDLARVVGLIAAENPEHAVRIEWHEGAPEHTWLVVADDGIDEVTYVVDDETGHWAPANEAELQVARGLS